MYDYGIENGYVYLENEFHLMNVYISGEKIALVTTDRQSCREALDVKGKYVLPGFIDPHVHFALGVGDKVSKDDFREGSMEAALGGVTTYIDFLDPVKIAEDISTEFEKRDKMASNSIIDYAFHTTIANPSDSAETIIKAGLDVGINSVKLFTTYADTDRRTYDNYIYSLLEESGQLGARIVIHAENDDLICHDSDILIKDHSKARPVISENVEVMKLAQMAKKACGNLYIVHVSAGSSVKLLDYNFKEEIKNNQIILESCPHYFLINDSVLNNDDGYKYTMTPPLRPEIDRQLLDEYVDSIYTIGTDHCPYTREQKKHIYTSETPMGIGGIRYTFLNMYNKYGFDILDKYTINPAKAYGLEFKGSLLPGMDADITIFDKDSTTIVEDDMSVYFMKELNGKIDMVLSRGKVCMKQGKCSLTQGKYIARKSLK